MSEYRKQAAFLRKLVMHEDTPANRDLCERMAHVDHCERCTQCACRLVGLIALLGLAGLGYSAVLLPEFFDSSTHFIVRLCCALGLGSTICFAAFLVLWFSYRRTSSRLHAQCRVIIAKIWAKQIPAVPATATEKVIQDEASLRVETLRRTVAVEKLPAPDLSRAA